MMMILIKGEKDDNDADLGEEGWHSEPVVDNGECGVGVDRHVEHYEPKDIKLDVFMIHLLPKKVVRI